MFTSRNHNLLNLTKVNEQSAMVSQDLQERLKDYLSDDDLISDLAEKLSKYRDGKYTFRSLGIDTEKYGIPEDDKIYVKIDKRDSKNPRFFMWIMNEQFLWGDIDLETAAGILKAGGEGTAWYERGLIGSIGSFLSGGGADAGTDEETIAGVLGAITEIAAEKGVDPEIYFNKLSEVFSERFGQSIKDFLEEEFSGYAEVTALNAFRQKIESSVWRGLNPWSILGDIALTIVTFGGSAAFTAGLRGAKIADAAAKSAKSTKVGAGMAKGSATLGRATGAISKLIPFAKKFNTLPAATRLSSLGQAGIKKGRIIKYKHGSKFINHKVLDVTESGVKLQAMGGTRNVFTVGHDKFLQLVEPTRAQKALSAAGLLAGKKVSDRGQSGAATRPGDPGAGTFAKGAEAFGYYDTLAADPKVQINNMKSLLAQDMAALLLNLKNGSGIFGNTTDQEECMIALLITGLVPTAAKDLSVEYRKIDANMNVYDVIDDELGGDIAIFAKAYWTACTGEGDEYKPVIKKIRERIKKQD